MISRVGGGLKNRTFALEFVAQDIGIDQVAVMRDCHLAAHAIDHQRLRVLDRAGAGGRIAGVSDRPPALQLLQLGLTEHLRDQSHPFVNQKRCARPVAGDDARAFLTAMLEREQSVVGQHRRVWMAETRRTDRTRAAGKSLSLGDRRLVLEKSHENFHEMTAESTGRRPGPFDFAQDRLRSAGSMGLALRTFGLRFHRLPHNCPHGAF